MSPLPAPQPPIPTVAAGNFTVPPPPPLPPGMRPESLSRSLAGTLRGFMWAAGGMAAIAAALAISCLVTFGEFYAVRADATAQRRTLEQRWLDQDDALASATRLFITLWLVVFVLLIVWTNKAHTASRRESRDNRRWSHGWATGAWFIPIANLWLPKAVIGEIETIVTEPGDHRLTASGWLRQRAASNLGWVWWFLLLAGILPFVFSATLPVASDDIDSYRVRAFYVVRLMAFACWATSCVIGVFYVRLITRAANRSAGGEVVRAPGLG
jgi:hypothetical protein